MIQCIFYAPVSPTGLIWINWAETNKRRLIKHLNNSFAGWRDDGYAIKKFRAKPIEVPG